LNKGKESIYEIVINLDDIKLQFTRGEEQLLYDKVESTYSTFAKGALAVVASSDFVFAMSRLLENSIQNERIAISVFRSDELARRWIIEMRELHGKSYEHKTT